jgi:hypothetical protein
MKNLAGILLFMASFWLIADKVAILTPSENAKLTPLEKQRSNDASASLRKFLEASGIESEQISVDKIKNTKAGLAQYKAVLLLYLEPCPEDIWTELDKYVKNGGGIIWQGTKIRKNPLKALDKEYFSKLAGTEVKDYVCDPSLGVALINKFMWIKPLEGNPVLPGDGKKLYAVFAGEAVEIAPTENGETAAEWLERDRKTVDGPSVIVCGAGQGKTVFFSNYPLLLSRENDSSPSVKAAGQMLLDALKFLGLKINNAFSHIPKRDSRPLNWTPIQTKHPRAMWVWQNVCALDPKEREQLFRFCQLRKINTLFLYTGPSFFKDKTKVGAVREFLIQAHELGIKVHALDGWPDAVEPDVQDKFLASLMSTLAYNAATPVQEERFDGFQSDVEQTSILFSSMKNAGNL